MPLFLEKYAFCIVNAMSSVVVNKPFAHHNRQSHGGMMFMLMVLQNAEVCVIESMYSSSIMTLKIIPLS